MLKTLFKLLFGVTAVVGCLIAFDVIKLKRTADALKSDIKKVSWGGWSGGVLSNPSMIINVEIEHENPTVNPLIINVVDLVFSIENAEVAKILINEPVTIAPKTVTVQRLKIQSYKLTQLSSTMLTFISNKTIPNNIHIKGKIVANQYTIPYDSNYKITGLI